MKIAKSSLVLTTLLALLSPEVILAHEFGSVPYDDVIYAAQNSNTCKSLPTEKLIAYMLAPTWWEVAGADSTLTPSPMTLGRGDNDANLYPDGQSGGTAPYRRAFWHPGIGAWQLDDAGLGTNASFGKFDTWDSAQIVAQIISARYCKSPTASYVFSPWVACGTDGSNCEGTVEKIYNPNGPPQHPIERDTSVDRYGGAEVHTCRLAGQLATFICVYVNPQNAQGTTSTWIYAPDGQVPPATPSPLAKPFYVYREEASGQPLQGPFEWRYWMSADTGFGADFAARRMFGSNSRDGLHWVANAETSLGLCDVTTLRGACGVCPAGASTNGLAASCGPSSSPTITTNAASNITQQSASLNLSVNPNGSTASVWFEWGLDTNFGNSTTQQSVAGANGDTALSMTIAGLSCNTTYYFRARAQNSVGPATGTTLSLRTNACSGTSQTTDLVADPGFEGGNNAWWVASPAFYIDHAPTFPNPHSGIYYAFLSTPSGTAGNNLQGGVISPGVTISPNASSATLDFWYSVSTQETTTTTAFDTLKVYIVTPGNQLNLLATISNLDSTGTQYRERNINLPSSFFGQAVQIFFAGSTDSSRPTVFRIDDVNLWVTTPIGGPPSVASNPSDQITSTSARLNMTVNPNGASTSVWFNLEPGNPNPIAETEHLAIGADTQSESVSISAFGLQCGTTYYLRARASNAFGSASGTVLSFLTGECSGGAPQASTTSTADITQTSATLNAQVDANGLDTQAWFGWGTTTDLGQETVHASIGSTRGLANFSQQISDLTCGTTYYFQAHAVNSSGQVAGAILSFSTAACNSTCSVSMITPAGGETWLKERPHTIQWSASPACQEFSVNLIRDNAYEVTIVSFLVGSQFEWTPAAWLLPGSDLQLEVVGFGADGIGVSAVSDVFGITNPPIAPSILFQDRVEGTDQVGYSSSYGWGTTNFTSHSTANSYANIPGFYGYDVDSALTTSKIDVSDRHSLYLIFWQSFQAANFTASVWARAGQGGWLLLRNLDTTREGWWPVTIDLGAFLGQGSVEVSFQSHYSGNSVNSGAWFLDDIMVYEPLPSEFYTVQPCRVVDTRQNSNPLRAGETPFRYVEVIGNCGIPSRARAISANVTVVNPTSLGFVTAFPADQLRPLASTVNFNTLQVRGNNALLVLSTDGRLGVVPGMGSSGATVDFILDVNGYFFDRFPIIGMWQGTLGQSPASLQIWRTGNSFYAQLATGGNPPDDLAVLSASDTQLLAFRPADNDANVRLYLTLSGTQLCLEGDYTVNSTRQPLLLCK